MGDAGLRLGRLAAALGLALLLLGTLLLAACGEEPHSAGSTSSPTTGPDAGLRVSVDPSRVAPGATLEARVVNESDEELTYGAAYELERQMGDSFERVKLPQHPVIEIGYVAKPGETGPPVEVRIPKDALPGQYRVVIQRDVPDVGDLSGEFEVSG